MILEALLKWEDKLMGYKIHIITDYKVLEFFKTHASLSPRQQQWINYMSHYQFDITYVKGKLNKVADCLSRYFKSDSLGKYHESHEYVSTDMHINPQDDDLPYYWYKEVKEHVVELQAMQVHEIR